MGSSQSVDISQKISNHIITKTCNAVEGDLDTSAKVSFNLTAEEMDGDVTIRVSDVSNIDLSNSDQTDITSKILSSLSADLKNGLTVGLSSTDEKLENDITLLMEDESINSCKNFTKDFISIDENIVVKKLKGNLTLDLSNNNKINCAITTITKALLNNDGKSSGSSTSDIFSGALGWVIIAAIVIGGIIILVVIYNVIKSISSSNGSSGLENIVKEDPELLLA